MSERKKKFAVVLSGCGVYDGSEIHEAVLLLAAISRTGAEYQCFAPDIPQIRTVNHLNNESGSEKRNVLTEAARIARGNIRSLKEFSAKDFDVLAFPGGMGAALNLSDFALKGADCLVNEEVRNAVRQSFAAGLTIAAMCIAPVILVRVLGREGIKVTFGDDGQMAAFTAADGAVHEKQPASGVCVDMKHRIVTTPAYMSAKSIAEIAAGAENLVKSCLSLD